MKTLKHFITITFCMLTLHASAQLSVGLRTGYIKAWEEYGDVGLPDDARIHVNGFQISGLAYYQVNKYLSVGAEPGFAQRGAACEPGFIIFNSDTKLRLNCLELPVMIKGRYPVLSGKLEVFGKLGYGATMVASAYREVIDLNGEEPPVKTKLDIKDNESLNRFDHGLYTGFGFGWNIGRNQLFVETDYYFGMKDVDNFNTSKNRSVHIGVGYMIRL